MCVAGNLSPQAIPKIIINYGKACLHLAAFIGRVCAFHLWVLTIVLFR